MVKVTIFLLIVFFLIPGVLLSDEKDGNKQSLYTGLTFRNIGPAIMSGRISDIAVHPHDRATWYVAVGSGGVWKTENAGTTWTPIFDSQPSYSIGCVSLDPHNPNIVWVGTGENVSGRHVGFGDGIYKSLNGGKTWKNMGLKKSEHISRIVIDPRDTNVIYAAVEGPLWAPGGDRGLYKSTDGGETWVISLKISENTGITSVVMDPGNPDILYAAAYQRRRSVAAFMGGGPESAIYKSIDAGKHWRKLTDGLPNGHMGKIGLAVSPMKPGIVYATIEALEKEKGFYRSEDWGESWEKRNTYISGGTGPHYYQEIYADPHQFDCLYQMDVWMNVTYDGGKSFQKIGETFKHSDNHALAFDQLHHPVYEVIAAGAQRRVGDFETPDEMVVFEHGYPHKDDRSDWGPERTVVTNSSLAPEFRAWRSQRATTAFIENDIILDGNHLGGQVRAVSACHYPLVG
ncbi:MAG: hypothetical protein MUF15_19270, partial [Acidobacteria bacterium]|nr:hypothetical protein [Acidobacteriota bacterium]